MPNKKNLKEFILKKIQKYQDNWFQDNHNDYERELEWNGDYSISTYERAFEYAIQELEKEFEIDGEEQMFCEFCRLIRIDWDKYSQNKFIKLCYKFKIKFYKTLFNINNTLNYYA